MPRRYPIGRRRKEWAQHLGVAEDRLLEMLGHLELKTDYGPWSALVDVTAERMAALGLRFDEAAVYSGASSIRSSRVTQGLREIDRNAMERELDRLASTRRQEVRYPPCPGNRLGLLA